MALQKCASCGRFRYPPRPLCPHCQSQDARWTAVSGRGQVHVSLVVHRAPSTAWQDDVPYNVSMIALPEGVRMWSNVIGVPPEEVRIGDGVEITYVDVTKDVTLPRFRPTQGR